MEKSTMQVKNNRDTALPAGLEALVERRVEELLAAKLAEKEARPKKMAIIFTKGSLDWCYPPLILANTAAAYGWDVGIFFTFYGLNLIHRKNNKRLKVSPVGNPAMPVAIPNFIAALPGMTAMATSMMQRTFRRHGMASVSELLELAAESGVKLFPCGTTIHAFGYKQDDFVDGVQPIAGSAAFVHYAADADISLFI
jgi:peroxiredoxin family protein